MDGKEMICYCSDVTKGQIMVALNNGAKTLADVRRMTGACTLGRCEELSPRKKCCSPIIMKIIEEHNGEGR